MQDLRQKLPGILALMQTLMEKETGLQWLEVVVRYLASVLDEEELSLEQIKKIAEQAISKETGGYVMTLAEKLRKEGEERGTWPVRFIASPLSFSLPRQDQGVTFDYL